jgi:phospholipid-binding lipoprotein MlaA
MVRVVILFAALSVYGQASHTADIPVAGGPEKLVATDVGANNAWLFDGLDKKEDAPQGEDPLEQVNRPLYALNHTFVEGLVLRPLSVLYRDTVNNTAKEGIENFTANLFLPLQTMNHTLQGDGERAFHSIFRFVINSTVGLLGLLDAASKLGFPDYETSFNETLTTWGMESGPYLVLPVFGPSCFRGAAGLGGDWAMNPWRIYVSNTHRRTNRHGQEAYLLLALYGVDTVCRYAHIAGMVNDSDKTSKDPYVSIRNYYFQQQRKIEARVAARKKNNAAERAGEL